MMPLRRIKLRSVINVACDTDGKYNQKENKEDMTLKELEAKIQQLEDIEAIRKLQYAYGYYLAHWQEEEIVDLFSDDAVLDLPRGIRRGKEAIRKYYDYADHYATGKPKPPGFLHQLMPLCGIIDIETDGKTAKGRWYGFGLYGLPIEDRIQALIGTGIWENEFVKEDGIWKFKTLLYRGAFNSRYEKGWVEEPSWAERPISKNKAPEPLTDTVWYGYPSGNVLPYHYKNPVSRK